MALDNYVNLQAEVADWLNREDLAAVIPTFIALVDSDLKTELRSRIEVAATLNAPAGVASLTLPPDVRVLNNVSIQGVYASFTRGGPLKITTPALLDYYAGLSYNTPGQPRYCTLLEAVDGTKTLTLTPTPDQDYTLNLVYDAVLGPLASNSTNWVLTNHPLVYLYGALLHAAKYLKEDERVATWQAEYEAKLEKLRLDRENLKWGVNTPVARVNRPIGG